VLVPDGDGRLVTIASHGYADGAVGGEVRVGEGLIGVVAQTAGWSARSASTPTCATRARARRSPAPAARLPPEVPCPACPTRASQLALLLLAHDRLLGVLALEGRDTLTFAQWHEAFLQVLANQIALSMEHMAERDDDEPPAPSAPPPPVAHRARTFCFYQSDDCVFVDAPTWCNAGPIL
jgi:GAF domain-containing protein